MKCTLAQFRRKAAPSWPTPGSSSCAMRASLVVVLSASTGKSSPPLRTRKHRSSESTKIMVEFECSHGTALWRTEYTLYRICLTNIVPWVRGDGWVHVWGLREQSAGFSSCTLNSNFHHPKSLIWDNTFWMAECVNSIFTAISPFEFSLNFWGTTPDIWILDIWPLIAKDIRYLAIPS